MKRRLVAAAAVAGVGVAAVLLRQERMMDPIPPGPGVLVVAYPPSPRPDGWACFGACQRDGVIALVDAGGGHVSDPSTCESLLREACE